MLKTMNDSYFVLKENVPFEITSRYLASYIELNGTNCSYYIN